MVQRLEMMALRVRYLGFEAFSSDFLNAQRWQPWVTFALSSESRLVAEMKRHFFSFLFERLRLARCRSFLQTSRTANAQLGTEAVCRLDFNLKIASNFPEEKRYWKTSLSFLQASISFSSFLPFPLFLVLSSEAFSREFVNFDHN